MPETFDALAFHEERLATVRQTLRETRREATALAHAHMWGDASDRAMRDVRRRIGDLEDLVTHYETECDRLRALQEPNHAEDR